MDGACSCFRRHLFLMLMTVTLVLSGCAPFKEWQYLPATKGEERTIHVVSHGWHTGIILSRQDLTDRFRFLDDHLGPSPYYEFGWGEADFYQADKNTASLALKALFWRNDTVMHVVAVPTTPRTYFNRHELVELTISETGLDHLRRALSASFRFDGMGRPYPLGKGLYGDSRFFVAEGYYYLTNTCNRWTASLLNRAGVPMDTAFTLRAKSVIRQAEAARERYACCTRQPRAPAYEHLR
jgi:uncharacterized protein (TIGR02117 family)